MHWRRKWQPTPVFLPGESQGREGWWAAVYGVAQSRTRLERRSSSSKPSRYWSWNSNILGTWCEELTHWKRLWCCERLKAGGDKEDRGWDGWMASPTQWTWVWVSSGSWWWTGKPGVLQSMRSQSQTRLSDWTELKHSRKQCNPANTLILSQCGPRQISNIQNYKIIHLCANLLIL